MPSQSPQKTIADQLIQQNILLMMLNLDGMQFDIHGLLS